MESGGLTIKHNIFQQHSEESFNELALAVFDFQAKNNPVYREFLELIGVQHAMHYTEIPCLPISFFKTHKVVTGNAPIEKVFKSSGTSKATRSNHFVTDLQLYEKSFTAGYEKFIGNPKEQVILALLPNYVEQGDSSLVYMVQKLIQQSNSKLSGFLLENAGAVETRYKKAISQNKKVILIGVSYALLDLAETEINLSKASIIETGGMKGRRKELSKKQLHEKLKKGLHVNTISSEYGMTELLSQAYSNSDGLFSTPPWMKVLLRDTNDPLHYSTNKTSGGINIIDLGNLYSCSFIATDDLGRKQENRFELIGRMDYSDIRGCNLMVE